MGVSKNRGKTPKMDGENHGKPYEQMDDLGENPLFLEAPIWRHLGIGNHQDKPHQADRRVAFGVSDSSVFWRWNGSFGKDTKHISYIIIIIPHRIHVWYAYIYLHFGWLFID